jgi:hypothetical protein
MSRPYPKSSHHNVVRAFYLAMILVRLVSLNIVINELVHFIIKADFIIYCAQFVAYRRTKILISFKPYFLSLN